MELPLRCGAWLFVAALAAMLEAGSAAELRSLDLFFVRHGESVDNVFPRQGPFGLSDPPLTKVGREQARQAAMCMSATPDLPEPDFVFASCLLRAQETALLAFPNQSKVYVAPYICEEKFGQPIFWPASQPSTYASQLTVVGRTEGNAAASRLDFGWAPPIEKCGPADWSNFKKWLLGQPGVRGKLESLFQLGKRPSIVVVSHGNFLGSLLPRHGWKEGHPENAEVIQTVLPMEGDLFGDFHFVKVICGGVGSDVATKHIWYAIAAGVVFLCVCAVASQKCRRSEAKQEREGYKPLL